LSESLRLIGLAGETGNGIPGFIEAHGTILGPEQAMEIRILPVFYLDTKAADIPLEISIVYVHLKLLFCCTKTNAINVFIRRWTPREILDVPQKYACGFPRRPPCLKPFLAFVGCHCAKCVWAPEGFLLTI